jgi:hypothetical protein
MSSLRNNNEQTIVKVQEVEEELNDINKKISDNYNLHSEKYEFLYSFVITIKTLIKSLTSELNKMKEHKEGGKTRRQSKPSYRKKTNRKRKGGILKWLGEKRRHWKKAREMARKKQNQDITDMVNNKCLTDDQEETLHKCKRYWYYFKNMAKCKVYNRVAKDITEKCDDIFLEIKNGILLLLEKLKQIFLDIHDPNLTNMEWKVETLIHDITLVNQTTYQEYINKRHSPDVRPKSDRPEEKQKREEPKAESEEEMEKKILDMETQIKNSQKNLNELEEEQSIILQNQKEIEDRLKEYSHVTNTMFEQLKAERKQLEEEVKQKLRTLAKRTIEMQTIEQKIKDLNERMMRINNSIQMHKKFVEECQIHNENITDRSLLIDRELASVLSGISGKEAELNTVKEDLSRLAEGAIYPQHLMWKNKRITNCKNLLDTLKKYMNELKALAKEGKTDQLVSLFDQNMFSFGYFFVSSACDPIWQQALSEFRSYTESLIQYSKQKQEDKMKSMRTEGSLESITPPSEKGGKGKSISTRKTKCPKKVSKKARESRRRYSRLKKRR